MANLLNFDPTNYNLFEDLSMMACITKSQKSKFANTTFREFDHSGQGRQIKFHVYYHPVGNASFMDIGMSSNLSAVLPVDAHS